MSHSFLRKVDPFSFASSQLPSALFLNDNKISAISSNAFTGLKFVSELYMQKNKLVQLPRGMLKKMTVHLVSLFQNSIQTLDGVFEDLKQLP